MKKAFTLIELLIVVAIIAILAAIAVPNFLEAQTRSKISRAQADMRSICLAMEAYRIDSNVYPWWAPDIIKINGYKNDSSVWKYPYPPTYVCPVGAMTGITTPIAYISSHPADPFKDTNPNIQYRKEVYYGGYGPQVGTSYMCENHKENLKALLPEIWSSGRIWGMYSIGPDGIWMNLAANGQWDTSHHAQYDIYDPTNGTVSIGNIWRVGP